MVSTHIDGTLMASAIVSGIHRVISEQEFLNRINVFPVADGDTGTNLSLSLGAALPVLKRDNDKPLGKLLENLADALLDGARGNSGAIMAQFFQGMSDSAGELSRFTTSSFGKAVQSGSDYAHDALSNPREGTILSVIAVFARSLQRLSHDDGASFSTVMPVALKEAEAALTHTTDQLDALKKAGVVDAGAKGFVALISGMHDYLLHGEMHEEPDLSALLDDTESPASMDHSESRYRFCTECMVTGDDIDRRQLREALGELGDSLVLAGTKRKAKIHIHVDEPDRVFALARTYGDVSGEKADDMRLQQRANQLEASRPFAIAVDSAADVPDEMLEKYDIHTVPLRVQFGERGYLDKVSITPAEFFAELEQNPAHPTTSQPAPGDFRRQFQFLASHYADVLSINVTGKVSGTRQAAESAAERVEARGQIRVLDSMNASTGQGLIAVTAAELADAGVPLDEAMPLLEDAIRRTKTFAILSDLRYAVRGGRVPGWVRVIADFLRMIAILKTTPDGRVAPAGFLVGRKNRSPRFARYVAKRAVFDGTVNISISHALCEDDAVELASALRKHYPDIRRLTICELGSAIGVHGGKGTLVVSVQAAGDA